VIAQVRLNTINTDMPQYGQQFSEPERWGNKPFALTII